jgi:hypothetical protein
MAAAVGAIVLIVLKNRANTADVWLFARYEDVNVLWLMLVTAASAVVAWWGVWKISGIVREYREVRRRTAAEADAEEARRLAREAAEREKRLDEKLRRSIRDQT